MNEVYNVDEVLDLRGTPCPLNYVKTKLKLEEMQEGKVLEIIIDEGEPIRSVPRSIKDDGHKIIDVKPEGEAAFKLFIRKA